MEHKDEDIFYRTDHHWTSLGAYYGYTGLASALGYTPVPLTDYTPTVRSTEFYGTVFSSSGVRWVQPDTITTYVPDDGITVVSHTYDNSGNPVEEQRALYVESFLSVKDKYSMFLGGNQSLGVVTNTNNPDGPKLLIIRDSYADSLVPFLTAHYSEIHLIDPREGLCGAERHRPGPGALQRAQLRHRRQHVLDHPVRPLRQTPDSKQSAPAPMERGPIQRVENVFSARC